MRNLKASFGIWKERRFRSLIFLALFSILVFNIEIGDAKRSACWRYGHSCYGGHGKRSGDGSLGDLSPRPLSPEKMVAGRLLPLGLLTKMLSANRATNEARKMEEDDKYSSGWKYGVDNSIFSRNSKSRPQSSTLGNEDGSYLERANKFFHNQGILWSLRQ